MDFHPRFLMMACAQFVCCPTSIHRVPSLAAILSVTNVSSGGVASKSLAPFAAKYSPDFSAPQVMVKLSTF
jgi:hypothetical protein